jgi:macrolide-specific efflux system membrane fusion protein
MRRFQQRRILRLRWPLIAAGAGVIILAVAAYRLAHRGAKDPEFREFKVARGDMTITISAAGEISPQNRIELKPPLAGRIERILVREGDYIEKGQVLAWISSTDRASLLDAARAKGPDEVARWEDVYKPTPLVAPLSGFIIARRCEPGQTIGGGDPPLVMADRLIVRAQVDETDMSKIKIGQKAEVSLDAYPDIRLPGRLDHLAYEARSVNNVTVYDIEIELAKSSSLLRSGMTATVSVSVDERKKVLLVPAEALKDSNGGLAVMLKKGKKPEQTPVTIGLSDGAQVEIVKGLKEGDILLIPAKALVPSMLADTGSPLMPGGLRARGGGRGGGGGHR